MHILIEVYQMCFTYCSMLHVNFPLHKSFLYHVKYICYKTVDFKIDELILNLMETLAIQYEIRDLLLDSSNM